MNSITYIGLDVHKRSIAVAMLQTGTGEVQQWDVANEPTAVRRLIRKLKPHAPRYMAEVCAKALNVENEKYKQQRGS